jgi:nucleoid-associated protein YgaU
MGFFDRFKKGAGQQQAETVKGPTRVLREAGIDTSCLNCKVGMDGSVTVSGTVDSDTQRQEIVAVLEGMPNVSGVVNNLNVGQPEPETATEEAVEADAPGEESATENGRTYTVKSGDTLWKISQEMYGNGSKYMKIFEANTPLLENPDKIFPGQELTIPDLDE